MSDTLPYAHETHIPCLVGVKNYLNNHFAMYTCLMRFRKWMELASPAYMGLRVI